MTPDRGEPWPALPTETEIYILPDGQVVIADLPAELAAILTHLAVPVPPALLDCDESAIDTAQKSAENLVQSRSDTQPH